MTEDDKQFTAMQRFVQERKNRTAEEYNKSSAKRLNNILVKKMTTIMIGAISEFESAFGFLWGKDSKTLSAEQRRLKLLWQDARNNILNKGNTQIRGAQQEIAQYDIKWNRYHTDINIQPHNERLYNQTEDDNE
jgi:hypothetical protein